MAQFKINLIRSKVIPRQRRRTIFIGLMAYLVISSLILVLFCNRLAVGLVRNVVSRQKIVILEKGFYKRHPQINNLPQYASQMKMRMSRCIAKLEIIDNFLSRRSDSGLILQRLHSGLPQGAYINNFKVSAKEQVLNFEITVYTGKRPEAFNIDKLVSAWKKDKGLMSQVENLSSGATRRDKIGDQPVFMASFNCRLKKGGI